MICLWLFNIHFYHFLYTYVYMCTSLHLYLCEYVCDATVFQWKFRRLVICFCLFFLVCTGGGEGGMVKVEGGNLSLGSWILWGIGVKGLWLLCSSHLSFCFFRK